jgi:N-acetyl-anhydromuramyl-L-alanine amidase AmpD
MQGAHAGDAFFNQYGIGINLVGNFEYSTPTPKQLESLCRLMDFLMTRYHITSVKIYGHREVPESVTLCPGHYFPLDTLRYWYANYEPICASSVDVK